jgi:phage terminase large subunit-like protein
MSNSTPLSRQDKLALLDLLQEKERRMADDPLKYAKRHPKQVEAYEAMQAIRTLFWGNRVGKTEWGGEETAEYATLHHEHREVIPPFEIWVACPSFDVQEYTTQQKLLRYLPKKEIKRIEYIRGKIIRKIELKNGVVIIFKSYEQGREKFQGTGVRLIWFDEEPPHDIWEESFVRQEAGQQLDIIMTMTPIKGMTWVYDQIYLATDNQDLFVSTAGWDDNPWLTDAQKEQMSRGLSAQSIRVRRFGEFSKRVGLVASWWERSKHLKHYVYSIDQVKSPQDILVTSQWTFYEVLDPGFSDPAGYLFIGVDPDNNVHVINGYRETHLQPETMYSKRNLAVGEFAVRRGWTDIDNDSKRAQKFRQLHWNMTNVEKEPGGKSSWDEALAEKLAEYGTIQPGTGEPRLFISDELVRMSEQTGTMENWLVQEIENLVWLNIVKKDGEEIIPKWDDHRLYGHHFDGFRALCYFLIMYNKPIDHKKPQRQLNYDPVTGRLLS